MGKQALALLVALASFVHTSATTPPTTHLICTVGTNEVTYTHYPAQCVTGFNGVNYGIKTLCECQGLCEAQAEPPCLGFEYGANHGGAGTDYPVGACQLATKRFSDTTGGCFFSGFRYGALPGSSHPPPPPPTVT